MSRLRGAVGLVEIERLIGKLFAAFEVCSAASLPCAVHEQPDLLFGWRLRGSGGWIERGRRGGNARRNASCWRNDRRQRSMHPLVEREAQACGEQQGQRNQDRAR